MQIDAITGEPLFSSDEERNRYYNAKLGKFFLKKLAVATVVGVALAVVIKKLDSLENDEIITSTI